MQKRKNVLEKNLQVIHCECMPQYNIQGHLETSETFS